MHAKLVTGGPQTNVHTGATTTTATTTKTAKQVVKWWSIVHP